MTPQQDPLSARASLPDYVRNLIDTVKIETGYELTIQVDPQVPFTPHLHIGSARQPLHLLRLAPSDLEHQTHLTLSALHKIQRLCGAPPREQLIGVPKAIQLPPADHRELQGLYPNVPAAILDQLSEDMALSLVCQLVEIPVNIRVEREIAHSWPEHHPLQRAYLRSRVEQIDFMYSPHQENVAPKHSLNTLRQMSGAYLQQCIELSGSPPGLNFETYRKNHLDGRLLAIVEACPAPGHFGDRLIIDQWAAHLDMRDGYVWYRRGQ